MIAVPGYSHLFRRGAAYWFRRRVPKDLREAFPFVEWKASLGTKNLEEAKRLVRLRGVETDREIALARARLGSEASPPLTLQSAREIALGALAGWLAEDEAARLSDGPVAWENAATVLSIHAADYREALASGDWRSALREGDLALDQAGLWYPDGDPSRRALASELLKARIHYIDALAKRQAGEVVETSALPVISGGPAPSPSDHQAGSAGVVGGMTLGRLIDEYRAQRVADHGELSTDRKYQHVFRALEEALGRDRPIRAITKTDCRGVQELLRAIPAHAGKRYPGLSLREAVEAGRKDEAPLLAPNTVGSYLQNLAAVFNWAVDHDWLTKNPAKGLAKKGQLSVKRRGFKPDELTILFAHLADERSSAPWRFWVPALALYTGARANELCQLQVSDVGEEDGVQPGVERA